MGRTAKFDVVMPAQLMSTIETTVTTKMRAETRRLRSRKSRVAESRALVLEAESGGSPDADSPPERAWRPPRRSLSWLRTDIEGMTIYE